MSEPVLDSSVLIAIVRDEQFDTRVFDILEGAVMSAVNFAEVWTKFYDVGLSSDPRVDALFQLMAPIEPLTASQARLAADLRVPTRQFGLSLGDRACLALAMERGSEVYTAERIWANLQLPCTIHLIR